MRTLRAAADLRLELDHALVLFGGVVGERHMAVRANHIMIGGAGRTLTAAEAVSLIPVRSWHRKLSYYRCWIPEPVPLSG